MSAGTAEPWARPVTGEEYIAGIRDGREVYLYGERVKDVTTHPAFRNSVRMTARLYDALHDTKTRAALTCMTDTGNGSYTMRFFRSARSAADLVSVAHDGVTVRKKELALICTVPMYSPVMKLICRPSYSMTAAVTGSPSDYPLSSRLDENDTIFILDRVLIPWDNVFVYGDIEKANIFFSPSGFVARAMLHGCTRVPMKLDFLAGLDIKALDITGSKYFSGCQGRR
jgi:aromatic ring hydroxylase